MWSTVQDNLDKRRFKKTTSLGKCLRKLWNEVDDNTLTGLENGMPCNLNLVQIA
jgi:hypothetical protein